MRVQRTLNGVISCEGAALHSGQKVKVTIRPGAESSGVHFVRTDFDDGVSIPAISHYVTETFYSTTLGRGQMQVGTVEHLMAAFFGLGITNAEVRVEGDELPILDGSARDWVKLIQQVGVQNQTTAGVPELVVTKPIGVKEKDSWATLYPAEVFSIDCMIHFEHPAIGRQRWEGCMNQSAFTEEIASARTFGMLKEVEYLHARGRARGASVDNAIVLDERGVISPGGLRYKDEFVRHKVLDVIGDLSLLGMPIRGHLASHRAGHRVHQQLLKVLLDSRDCWEIQSQDVQEERRVEASLFESLRVVS